MAARLITFVFFITFLFNASAQKFTGFSKETAQYPADIRTMMGPNLPKEDEDLIANFSIDWKNNVYDSLQKKDIVDLSVLMYKQRSRAAQFKLLVTLLTTFKETKDSSEHYHTWYAYMIQYLNGKKPFVSTVNAIMISLNDLLREGYIYKTNAVQWKFWGGDFTFKTERDSFFVVFPKGNIKCYSKRDSIAIEGTSGVFYPLSRKWIGAKGTVTWERAGFKPEEVNVKLNKYAIELGKTEYKADSVIFTYRKYFKEPIMGKLSDMVMKISTPESSSYPQFDSYSKRFFFKDLYPNIDYDGGFSMRGAKIIGSGTETDLAKIVVKNDKAVLMEVRSKYFVFRPDRVNGINTIVKLNLERDSIFHSDLTFVYSVEKQEVNLLRSESYSSKSPYYDSYHNLNLDFEELNWRITQPKITMAASRASAIGKAKFESINFFNQLMFESLQGRDAYHPLVELNKFSKRIGSNKFMGTLFADHVGRSLSEVKQVLMAIAQEGYIFYNSETDEVTIKERLIDCLKAAAGKVDYDVVSFNSSTQTPLENATLDMDNFDLTINGIPRIAVSDSQNVVIYPAHDQIIMKENRSFQFDGIIDAGLFKIYGNNFFFDYNSFKINLQNVDSVIVSVYSGELDELSRPITRRVKNNIRHLTGQIQIDNPDNKAGLKSQPGFPKFTSRENSYVYYQGKEIENGVYPEESFYFELYPFEIDSLDNFSKAGMNFRGKFQSSGILPAIEQNLVLQPDYSLGFKYNPGPGGIPVYDGKATLYADIDLSNNGLRANGKLSYLTSTTLSKDFKFYPDSMNTQSDKFAMERQLEGTQFPKVNSSANYIHWQLGLDNKMQIKQGKEPFNMFNEKTSLAGGLTLEPKGLSGKGLMNLTSADLQSKHFTYKAESLDADTSRFLLKSLKKEGYTVLTEENVNSHIDFAAQKGEFVANEDYTKVDFPENKYISFLDHFKWNMDEKTLEMSARRTSKATTVKRSDKAEFEERFRYEEEIDGPRYISVQTKQDSLNFVSPAAVYDYQNNVINASDVKLIRVADAVIYPKNGKVTVLEAAQMKPLINTTIVANYKERLHTLYAADIIINSRKNFTGKGKYDYVDENEKKQVVTMSEINVDPDLHTIAMGDILETDTFTLSPHFGYLGKVSLNSTKPLLYFDGGVSIKTDCNRLNPSWLKFESEIDPKNILIPVSEEPVNINNNKIYSGIILAPDSIHIYPAFLSGRRGYNDKLITTSSGFLRYNKDSMKYEMASMIKFLDRDTIGSYLSLHKFNCIEYGEGKINLGADLGQMKIESYGSAAMNLQTRDVSLDIALNVDFMFDESAMRMMASKIDSFPNLEALNINKPLLLRGWKNTLGKKRAEKYREDMTLLGKPKEFPPELNHTISFTHLQLKWDDATNSYQSVGKIGVGNILNYQVNRMVDGFIMISKKRTSDLMDIYLKLDDNNFYYFGYSRGVMQAFSSNNAFVEILKKLSIRARQMDVKRGQTPYIYMVTSDTRFGNFLRDYRRIMRQKTQGGEQEPTEQLENQPNIDQPVVLPPDADDKKKDKNKPKEEPKKEENDEVIEVK